MIAYNKEELMKYLYYYLTESGGNVSHTKGHQFRNRYEHTKRVLEWLKLLYDNYEDKSKVRYYILEIAAIFHDIGYEKTDNDFHAQRSSEIFRSYANSMNWDKDDIDDICELIKLHSDKYLLEKEDLSRELILLMEADMLDEEGTMRIIWDCLSEGYNKPDSYNRAYEHMCKSIRPEKNPMVTDFGKKKWKEKWDLVEEFRETLKKDLFL